MDIPMWGMEKFNIKAIKKKLIEKKEMFEFMMGKELFEEVRPEAKAMLEMMKKDKKNRPKTVTKLLLGLTDKQMEDLIITDLLGEALDDINKERGKQ